MNSIQMVPLFSGSSGNAVFLQFDGMRFLVDVGCTTKSIVSALEQIGQNPSAIDAVFITHNHGDHMKGLDVFVRKFGIPVYATEKTWLGIYAVQKKAHPVELDHVIIPGKPISVGAVTIFPFPTPHDAAGSVGFRYTYKDHSIAIATDMGYFSDSVREALIGCEAVLIEANYDYNMLWNGPYPWPLKKRVDGQEGHLCNADCAAAICDLFVSGTKHFVLGHLSQENNSPMTAEKEIVRALDEISAVRDEQYFLSVANRFCPSEPVILFSEQSTAGLL